MLKKIWGYRLIYLMILPTIVYFLIFAYYPMHGIIIAFKDYSLAKGIWESKWVGLHNFSTLFRSQKFPQLLENTILISLYRLIFGFPVPILFALLLNEVRHLLFKRTIQTITYFPHFLSWVVFAGIVINLVGPLGIINSILTNLGREPINFLTNPDMFRSLLVVTGILKEFGWSAIIYLAALAGIDPQLYEAVRVDGGGRLRQIWHVTLPGLLPTISFLLILSIAGILDAGFDQIFMLYNGAVLGVADIIDTYVYRVGLLEAKFDVATAVGLFKGVVGTILIVTANHIIRRTGERSLW
jgi:putative aldouronate transport system permease protein